MPVDAAPQRAKGPLVLGAFALLLVGAAAGYLAGKTRTSSSTQATSGNPAYPSARIPSAIAKSLTPELQRDLDAAFDAMKNGRPADARQRMATLLKQRPDWTALNFEMARAALYQRDFEAAESLLEAGKSSGAVSIADAEFLLGLLRMNKKSFDFADHSFERAVAADPTRADIYFFWGECLRRQGKPFEASEKLRAALLRNQYETAESLYQIKLWLSEIQAEQDAASGSKAVVDAGLAAPHPTSTVLLAAAARALKAGNIPAAAADITRARQVMEPTVFHVIMQDPTFLQESWRTEMLEFFRQPKPPETPADAPSPAPSPQAVESQPTPKEIAVTPSPAPSPQMIEIQPTPSLEALSQVSETPAPSPRAIKKTVKPPRKETKPAAAKTP